MPAPGTKKTGEPTPRSMSCSTICTEPVVFAPASPFVPPEAAAPAPAAAGQLRPVDRPDSLFRKSFASQPRFPLAAAERTLEAPVRSPTSSETGRRNLLNRGSDVRRAKHARTRTNATTPRAAEVGVHHGHRHIETRQSRLNRLFTQPEESSVYREAPPFQRPRVSFARIIGDVTKSAAIP